MKKIKEQASLESQEEAIAQLALRDILRSMHFTMYWGDAKGFYANEPRDPKCVLRNHSGGHVKLDLSDIRHEINRPQETVAIVKHRIRTRLS